MFQYIRHTPYLFIKDLQAHGLEGAELYNYKDNDLDHAKDQDLINEYFAAMADKLGLIVTYGSDCHEPKGGGPRMGNFGAQKIIF